MSPAPPQAVLSALSRTFLFHVMSFIITIFPVLL